MPKDENFYRQALIGKKIPILVLDHQWHKLFIQTGTNEKMKALKQEMDELLKLQGRYSAEIKSLSAYKQKLMQEIVQISELPDCPEKDKRMGKNKQAIADAKVKLDEYKDLQMELPKRINDKNMELMMATLEVCYDKIQTNTNQIEEINTWINQFRNELKKKVLQKQRSQILNDEMYSYMHDIFGPDVIEMFDMKYKSENVLSKEINDENT